MEAINYSCIKVEEKATRNVKKNENKFINVVVDKFAMSIR